MLALAAARAYASTRVDHGEARRYLVREPHALIMINNPWINRIAAIVILLGAYVAGVDAGRERAVEAHQNHPACHQNLKP